MAKIGIKKTGGLLPSVTGDAKMILKLVCILGCMLAGLLLQQRAGFYITHM